MKTYTAEVIWLLNNSILKCKILLLLSLPHLHRFFMVLMIKVNYKAKMQKVLLKVERARPSSDLIFLRIRG